MPAFRTSCPRTIAILTFLLFCSPLGNSYSVLTHEEIVDLLWKQKIQPLLLKRFPDATEEDLRKAHAYAYGGCVLQDMGYYPFALGALAHYASDVSGHPIINRITAIEFPRLAKKYGKEVTYANDPKAHIRTEFGFDMVQVAKNRYTSDSYHDF